MKRFLKGFFILFLISFIAFSLYGVYEWHLFSTQNKKKLKNQDAITLVFAGDDNYIEPLSVALTSVNMNTKTPVEVFILTEGFSDKNTYFIRQLDDKLANINVRIQSINADVFEMFPINERWSKSIYFRYLIPELLPLKKRALYIDGDTLIFNDLSDFFNSDLENSVIAGVSDFEESQFLEKPLFKQHTFYINSGVLLMDLEKFRDLKLTRELFKATDIYKNEFTHYDQDAINFVLKERIKPLSIKYNAQHKIHIPFNKVIYHYSGTEKPWKKRNLSHYEWYKYQTYRNALLKNAPFPTKDYLKYLVDKILYYLTFAFN